MTTIFQENEVSLSLLAEHLENSGWNVELERDGLKLVTTAGLCFYIGLDDERKFLNLTSFFRIRKSFEDSYDLVNKLNSHVFLPSFLLDDDGDLMINYVMTYERGLILAQFMRIVRRFAGVLSHVLTTYDPEEQIFLLRTSSAAVSDGNPISLQ